MQKRFFNTTGYCQPEKHYMINPLRGVEHEIYALIENEQYYVIHAPRQSGKTTLLHSFVKQINAEGKYIGLIFSIERAGVRSMTLQEANTNIINAIYSSATGILPQNEQPPSIEKYSGLDVYTYIQNWSREQIKPIVLFIDEIDSLYDDVLVSILRQLRDGFQYRPKNFPQSIALVGLRDIRDYKMKARSADGSLGSGSPFNIKAKSFVLPNFTKDEIRLLYQQYTNETGQIFSEEVIELLYQYSDGQPWLTNALAQEITIEILKKNYSLPITREIAILAKENLIQRRDTHLDSLIDKLTEPRVKSIIEAIISGESANTDRYNDDLQYTLDLGIVKRTKDGIVISNKIYSEIIPRVLNIKWQDQMQPIVPSAWYIKDNRLQMDVLLKSF